MKLVVDVQVIDLDRAVAFYSEMLGFSCRRKEADWAAIEIGDAEIHLYLHAGVTSGIEFYVDDLDESVTTLKSKGIELIVDREQKNLVKVEDSGIIEFPWGRTAFFADSEGNRLAFVKDFE